VVSAFYTDSSRFTCSYSKSASGRKSTVFCQADLYISRPVWPVTPVESGHSFSIHDFTHSLFRGNLSSGWKNIYKICLNSREFHWLCLHDQYNRFAGRIILCRIFTDTACGKGVGHRVDCRSATGLLTGYSRYVNKKQEGTFFAVHPGCGPCSGRDYVMFFLS